MALQWADFPSGQKGIYGIVDSYMLNGVYASTAGANVVEDPVDPNGYCLQGVCAARYILSSSQTTVGVAQRLWMSAIPANNTYVQFVRFKSAGDDLIASVRVNTVGGIAVYNAAGLIAETTVPVLVANAFAHIEVKIVRSTAGSESIEVRVNGTTKLSSSTLTFSEAGLPIAAIELGINAVSQQHTYRKDLVIWDGSGSSFNDFQGTVSVRDLLPDADSTVGGWVPNIGTTAWDLLDDDVPSNALTSTGTTNEDDVVRISSTYYKFTSLGVDVGTPLGTSGSPWLVNRGANTEAAFLNLFKAINASGTGGTDYSTALTAHPLVEAIGLSPTQLVVGPLDGTTRSMTFTETGANMSWAGSSSMLYRPVDSSYISADDTLPAAAEVTVSALPEDTTSIRGLISIVRALNSDGGDGNLQVSLTPNGTNYAAGLDRPLTTAATYYKDVSVTSPATAAAWSISEVNSLRIKFNRTV